MGRDDATAPDRGQRRSPSGPTTAEWADGARVTTRVTALVVERREPRGPGEPDNPTSVTDWERLAMVDAKARRSSTPATETVDMGPPLSAAAFRRLVDDAALDLAAGGVSAAFASTAGSRRAPGPTWISLTSRWGYGRLIRRADGSFDCRAHRIPGGEPLRAAQGERVRREHLDDLIAALARPGPDIARPQRPRGEPER